MKKINSMKLLKWSLLGVGGSLAIAGAGTLGGTYSQYSNYQLIVAEWESLNELASSTSSTMSLNFYVDYWNLNIKYAMTEDNKNSLLQTQKYLRKTYPTFESFKVVFNSIDSTDGVITLPPSNYNSEKTLLSAYNKLKYYDYNTIASESGLIAGSTLLAFGGVMSIAGASMFLVNKNKKNWN